MSGVIDSLVVELGFDTGGIQTGRKQVTDIFKHLRDDAEGTGKRIEGSAKKIEEAITKTRNGLLGLLAAFTAGKGVQAFIADITGADTALGRLSRTSQTAVSTISELEGATAASGGSAAGMASTIAGLQSAAQQFAITGQSSVLPYLRALGVQFKLGKDGAIDVNEELTDLAAAAQRLGGGARAAEMLRGAGISDEGTLNLLLQGPAALARFRAEIAAAGTPKQSDIDAANRRNQAWVVLDRAITTIGRNILTTLTPALLAVGKALTTFIETISHSPGLMTAATVAFGALTAAIVALSAASIVALTRLTLMRSGFTAILPWIWRIVAAIGTAAAGAFSQLALSLAVLTETTFPALSAAFLSLGAVIEATPIGWLLTIVAALGFAGYELVEHWSAVSGFFKTMWNDIAGYFTAGVQKIEKIPAVRWALRKLGIAAPGAGGSAPSKPSPSGAGSTSASASDKAINTVLQNEDRGLTGKVINDSGGITKYGVSSKAHPGVDVANISLADAKKIYKTEYWDPIGGDSLPAALQATALDAAINQGVGNAKAWLKASGGDPIKFNALRRGQYEHLAASNPEKYGKYLKGWESRIPSATQTALATASAGASTASLPRLGAGTSVLAANPSSTSVTNNNSEVSMGNVIIQTRATDPKGIAASIKPLLKNSVLVAQSQYGVS